MSKSVCTVSIVFNKLPQLKGQSKQKASQAVRKAAFDIEAGAKQRAPVNTGALKNSIEATGEDGKALAAGGLMAEIGPGVDYGIFVELGTHKQAAKPYLTPAAEAVKPSFLEAMKRIVDD
jgi:HK97 gp10 family phage protein